jgi:predicted nucleotidyltransferase
MLFQPIAEQLTEAGVEFVVIGGVAANLLGSPRLTYDFDVCYAPNPQNRARLAALLKTWKAYMRGVEPGLPWTMDARQFEISPVMTLTTTLGDLDVMDKVAGVGEYADVLSASIEVDVDGLRLRILDLPALIKAKRATSRQKDRDQLPGLEALLELRERRAES